MALSEDQRSQILADFNTGSYSKREIAKMNSVGVATVSRLTTSDHVIVKHDIRRFGNIYLMKVDGKNIYKIGVANDVGIRLKTIQTAHYENITIARTFYSEDVYELEKRLHQKYTDKGKRIRGEWFKLEESDIKDIEVYVYGNK